MATRRGFEYRPGHSLPVSPDVVGAVIDRVKKESPDGKKAEPSALVEASRPPDAPLHDLFEWRTDVAAQNWNEHEARRIIHSVIEVEYLPNGTRNEVIAYVHVPLPGNKPGYQRTIDVLNDEESRIKLLANALSVLRGFQQRYNHLAELRPIFKEIDKVAEKVERKAKKRPVAHANA